MQVGLNRPLIRSSSSALKRRQASSISAMTSSVRLDNERIDFPELALLSKQPARYNIQLNHQITTLQQADNYLDQLEQQLIILSKEIINYNGKSTQASVKDTSAPSSLQRLLEQRISLSDGTIDRQLEPVLEGKSTLRFTFPQSDKWLEKRETETLYFSLAGKQRRLCSVNLKEEDSPEQIAMALNLGLGKLGIYVQWIQQQLIFTVNEEQWSQLNHQLSVSGEGHRHPQGQFFPLKPQAEIALTDHLQQLINKNTYQSNDRQVLRNIIDNVIKQRQLLSRHRYTIGRHINELEHFSSAKEAIDSAKMIRNRLAEASSNYYELSMVVGAQAQITPYILLNLLRN